MIRVTSQDHKNEDVVAHVLLHQLLYLKQRMKNTGPSSICRRLREERPPVSGGRPNDARALIMPRVPSSLHPKDSYSISGNSLILFRPLLFNQLTKGRIDHKTHHEFNTQPVHVFPKTKIILNVTRELPERATHQEFKSRCMEF
ncbi:hypothetical protein OUZ56_007473 [Daphnia magna]|uniref:Uncharacterized protein n=1 Tax=Daphnia magna TaxID=35525 RepID=A0ABR0AA24_9CRUS|nr:hypothetical protein OUZ56_007473 [Daphnia magna]